MEMQFFKTGDVVKITKNAYNACQFTESLPVPINGVYSIKNWKNTEFQIGGRFERVSYDSFPEIYGAYPILLKDRLVGYVYNVAIELVKTK